MKITLIFSFPGLPSLDHTKVPSVPLISHPLLFLFDKKLLLIVEITSLLCYIIERNLSVSFRFFSANAIELDLLTGPNKYLR